MKKECKGLTGKRTDFTHIFQRSIEQPNSNNKTTTANPGRREKSHFQNCHTVLIKMPTFHQNIVRHAKKKESMDRENFIKAINRNYPWQNPDVRAPKPKLCTSYFKYFQTTKGKYEKDALTAENISEGVEIIKIPVLKSTLTKMKNSLEELK